ncbi:hypothetical protein KQI65_15750 [bacterium]|nr:hypothetical protein [bacterium]
MHSLIFPRLRYVWVPLLLLCLAVMPLRAQEQPRNLIEELQVLLPGNGTSSEVPADNLFLQEAQSLPLTPDELQAAQNLLDSFSTKIAETHSVPLISQTAMIDALASTIARRFKEEVTTQAVKHLKELLNDPSLKPLLALLPGTTRFLNTMDVGKYSSFLVSLRDAIEADLRNMPQNLGPCLEILHESVQDPALKQRIAALRTVQAFVVALRVEQDYDYALDQLLQSEWLPRSGEGFASAMRIMGSSWKLISHQGELLSISKLYTSNNPNVNLYFTLSTVGLWLETNRTSLKTLHIGDANEVGTTMFDAINAGAKDIDQARMFVARLQGIAQSIARVQVSIKNLTMTLTSRQLTTEDYLRILQPLAGVAIQSLDMASTFKVEQQDIMAAASSIEDLTALAANVQQGEYGLAVAEALILLRDRIPDEQAYQNVYEVLTFAANAATAENAEQLADALDAFFLPAGSYRIKREAELTIAVNAYAGPAYYGEEGEDMSFGFFSPTGVEISSDCIRNWSGGVFQSIGVFASAIDLGPVVNYRLQYPDGDIPELKFSDLLSPGASLMVGTPWFVSIGAGYRSAPYLERVSATETALKRVHRREWNIMLAVDIPLFNFYVSR